MNDAPSYTLEQVQAMLRERAEQIPDGPPDSGNSGNGQATGTAKDEPQGVRCMNYQDFMGKWRIRRERCCCLPSFPVRACVCCTRRAGWGRPLPRCPLLMPWPPVAACSDVGAHRNLQGCCSSTGKCPP